MDTWKGILGGTDALLADLLAGRRLLHHWLRLSLGMILCTAVYGAVLGFWHGPRLAAYAAVKLLLVLLLTAALTVGFGWIAAALLGLPLRFGQVTVLTFLALAAGSALLVSLAPVAWLFTVCAPPPSGEARTAHNLLYLLHTAFVGGCGSLSSSSPFSRSPGSSPRAAAISARPSSFNSPSGSWRSSSPGSFSARPWALWEPMPEPFSSGSLSSASSPSR